MRKQKVEIYTHVHKYSHQGFGLRFGCRGNASVILTILLHYPRMPHPGVMRVLHILMHVIRKCNGKQPKAGRRPGFIGGRLISDVVVRILFISHLSYFMSFRPRVPFRDFYLLYKDKELCNRVSFS